jgi:cytochrome P450
MNSATISPETQETNKTPVPTLRGHALLGSIQDFRKRRLHLQRALAARGDLSRFFIGPIPVYMASSAELAHAVLVEQQDAFIKSRGLRVIGRPLLGSGLLTSEHDFHKRQRKLMAPAFAPKRIAGYATDMSRAADAAQSRFGESVDLAEEMMKLTLAIVGRTLFAADVLGEARAIGEALTVALHFIPDEVSRILQLPYSVPTPSHLRMRRAVKRLDQTVYRMIDERRAAPGDRGDVLSMLLAARDDDGSGMSPEQIRDEVMTLFLAGHETTANALTWAFYLLTQHPEIYARAREEARGVLGGRMPTVEDLPKMPFALQILKETMRLYPPAYIMGRSAERAVELGAHSLKKGAVVMINIFGIHHRADYFPDPERFLPSRFSTENEKQLVRGSYLPFGGGARVCIGNHFALMEAQLILTHLLQTLELHYDGPPVEPEPLVTLRPLGGLPVRVTRL